MSIIDLHYFNSHWDSSDRKSSTSVLSSLHVSCLHVKTTWWSIPSLKSPATSGTMRPKSTPGSPIPISPQTPVRPWNAAIRPLILLSVPLDKLRAWLQGPLYTWLVRRDLAPTMRHHTRFWPGGLTMSLFLGSEFSFRYLCRPSLIPAPVPMELNSRPSSMKPFLERGPPISLLFPVLLSCTVHQNDRI